MYICEFNIHIKLCICNILLYKNVHFCIHKIYICDMHTTYGKLIEHSILNDNCVVLYII